MKKFFNCFDVVLVNFGEITIGSEQGGIRPAVIYQNNTGNLHSPTTIVMPFTSRIKHLEQPTHTLIKTSKGNGLYQDSMILAEAIRQIDESRIIKFLGKITSQEEKIKIKAVCDANFEGVI